MAYVVRYEGVGCGGSKVFEGPFARRAAGDHARALAMVLGGEACLLTIADNTRWDAHHEGALVLSAYLYVPGSGWVHQHGTTIRGLDMPLACAAE
jgi:hypothetical protein